MSYLPPLQPGLSCAGDGMSLHGRLRNLAAQELAYQTAGVTWEHERAHEGSVDRVIVHVDGQLRSVAAADDNGVDLADLGVGDSSAQILTVGEYERPLPIATDPWGQNALLTWEPSDSADCVGYNIYNGALLVDSVTEVGAHERISAVPDSGTGTGRISAWGSVPDYAGNNTGTLTITGEGTAEFAFAGFAPETINFNRGSVVTVQPGFMISMLDDPRLYETGDSWTIRVGPAASYITAALEPGEYTFGVVAVDAAGNQSFSAPSPAIYIAELPGALDPDSVSRSFALDTLIVTFTQPAGADGVNVYTNFNPHTGEFEPYINTDGLPFAQVTTGQWVFDATGLDGQLLYYLRPYNAVTERDGGELYRYSFPPTAEDSGVSLEAPTGLVVTPTPAGNWRLEWDFLLPGSAATGFNIYRHVVDEPIDYATDFLDTVSVNAPESTGSSIRHYLYNSTAPEAGVIRLSVRSTDGVLESDNDDYVVLTPDATAPVFVGPVVGGAA